MSEKSETKKSFTIMTTETSKTKKYLVISNNIVNFLQIPDDELDKACLLLAFKKSKNEIIERVLTYVYDNNLCHDDGYIYPDKKLKTQLLLDNTLKKITEEKLVKSLDRHAFYTTI